MSIGADAHDPSGPSGHLPSFAREANEAHYGSRTVKRASAMSASE